MQIVKQLLGTNSGPDSETLRTRRDDAARKLGQGVAELERVTANVDKLKLDRARLIDQMDSEPGVDLAVPLVKVEGALTSGQKRHDDLVDILKVRQQQVAQLDQDIRSAEQQEAPARMMELSARHRELLADVRAGMAQAITALRAIPAIEQEGLQLQREYGAPPAKTTPLSYFAQDALQAIETIAAKMPPPFEEARRVNTAEKLREMEERQKYEEANFLRWGNRGPRYEEQAVQETGGVMVLNPRLQLSRELGTPFLGADYVTEDVAKQIRKEMETEGARH